MTYHKKSTWEWTGRGCFGEWRAEGLLTWLELRKEIKFALLLTIIVLWWFCFLALTLVSPADCELAAEGVWLALSWLCKIQVHVSAIISCVELIKHYTNRTDSFLLLEGPMERHRNLTIYQKCEMRMVSRSARSVIVAGQLRKCEDPVILPLVASVVLCTDFWSHSKIFRLQTSVQHAINTYSFLHYRGKSGDVIVPLSMSWSVTQPYWQGSRDRSGTWTRTMK